MMYINSNTKFSLNKYVLRCEDIATQLLNNMESGNLVLAFGGGMQKFRTVKNGGNIADKRIKQH